MNIIRHLRLSKKLSIAQLSELSSITIANISIFENEKRIPSLLSIYKLASALGVEPSVIGDYYGIKL